MTTIVTYICDRCKKEMPAADRFQVGFVISGANTFLSRSVIPQAYNSADWCRACCSELRLRTTLPVPGEPELSTSEKLEEVIKSIISEVMDDRD